MFKNTLSILITLSVCSATPTRAAAAPIGQLPSVQVLPAQCPAPSQITTQNCTDIQDRVVTGINGGLAAIATKNGALTPIAGTDYTIRFGWPQTANSPYTMRIRTEVTASGVEVNHHDVSIPVSSTGADLGALSVALVDSLVPSTLPSQGSLVVIIRGPHQVFEDTNTNANDLPDLETYLLADLLRDHTVPELAANTLQRLNIAATSDPDDVARQICAVVPSATFFEYNADLEKHTNSFTGTRATTVVLGGDTRSCSNGTPAPLPEEKFSVHHLGANGKIATQVINLVNFALSVARKNPSYARALGNGVLTSSALSAVTDSDDASAIRNAKGYVAGMTACDVAKVVHPAEGCDYATLHPAM